MQGCHAKVVTLSICGFRSGGNAVTLSWGGSRARGMLFIIYQDGNVHVHYCLALRPPVNKKNRSIHQTWNNALNSPLPIDMSNLRIFW